MTSTAVPVRSPKSAMKRTSKDAGRTKNDRLGKARRKSLTDRGAERVEVLANDPRFEPRKDDLNSLAEAIRDGEHEVSSPWASVSLFSAFPPASTVAVNYRSRTESWLGVLAGITVFMPVAWTWWSLRAATEAYSGMIDSGAAAGASFLELWSTGFDGQLAVLHQLAPMAFISFLLIMVSVGVIVGHRISLNAAAGKEQAAVAEAEAELASVLTLAQRALVSHNVDDPAHVASLVESSLVRLSAAHKETKESAVALREAVEETGETLRAASQESATHLVRGSKESSQSMVDSASAARRELEGTSKAVAEAATKTQEQLETMLRSADRGVEQSLTAIDGATESFAQSGAALRNSSERLAHSVEALGSEGRDAMAEFQKDFRKVAEQLQLLQNRQGERLDQTIEAVREIQVQLIQVQSAASGQVEELSRTREATERAGAEFGKASAALGRLADGRTR